VLTSCTTVPADESGEAVGVDVIAVGVDVIDGRERRAKG